MVKKITLETLAVQMQKGFASADRKFEALADDISRLTTKDQAITLQTQVNSIERQLRETRSEVRRGNLEEKVFGTARS